MAHGFRPAPLVRLEVFDPCRRLRRHVTISAADLRVTIMSNLRLPLLLRLRPLALILPGCVHRSGSGLFGDAHTGGARTTYCQSARCYRRMSYFACAVQSCVRLSIGEVGLGSGPLA